jgi:hypothetical protein
MFHVKHFGKIGEAEYVRASYIRCPFIRLRKNLVSWTMWPHAAAALALDYNLLQMHPSVEKSN